MIRKNRGEISWLEFNLLQGTNVQHAVFLKQGIDLKPFGIDKASGLHQVHGKEILCMDVFQENCVGDGMITKTKGKGLAIAHADCQAAIFYDPVQHVIGAVHAGWRGMVHNIYKEMCDCGVMPAILRFYRLYR